MADEEPRRDRDAAMARINGLYEGWAKNRTELLKSFENIPRMTETKGGTSMETNDELERLREDTRAAFSDAKQDIIKMRIRNLTESIVKWMEDLIEIIILDQASRNQEALEVFRNLRPSWKEVIDNASPETEEEREKADKKKTRFKELDRELTQMDSIMKSIEKAKRHFEMHTSESRREIRRLLLQLHDQKTAQDLRDWVIETINIPRRRVP